MPIKVHSSQLAVHRTAKTINRRFNPKNRFGFTLLELLVALGLLTVTVGSALVFLTSVLRGSNQSAIVTEVKQNGQSVLDSLERQMRDATEARQMLGGELPLGATNGLILTVSEARTLHVVCFSSTASANGWIGLANMQTGVSPSFSDYKSLTNNASAIEGVDISACSFSVVPATTVSPAIVSVGLTINQGVGAPSRSDFLSNAQFQTTISLRKY